jgi:chromosomal replication initiation ATPase DnaA
MFGGRDHTTILHGVKKIEAEVNAVSELGIAALVLKDKLRGEQ